MSNPTIFVEDRRYKLIQSMGFNSRMNAYGAIVEKDGELCIAIKPVGKDKYEWYNEDRDTNA